MDCREEREGFQVSVVPGRKRVSRCLPNDALIISFQSTFFMMSLIQWSIDGDRFSQATEQEAVSRLLCLHPKPHFSRRDQGVCGMVHKVLGRNSTARCHIFHYSESTRKWLLHVHPGGQRRLRHYVQQREAIQHPRLWNLARRRYPSCAQLVSERKGKTVY